MIEVSLQIDTSLWLSVWLLTYMYVHNILTLLLSSLSVFDIFSPLLMICQPGDGHRRWGDTRRGRRKKCSHQRGTTLSPQLITPSPHQCEFSSVHFVVCSGLQLCQTKLIYSYTRMYVRKSIRMFIRIFLTTTGLVCVSLYLHVYKSM